MNKQIPKPQTVSQYSPVRSPTKNNTTNPHLITEPIVRETPEEIYEPRIKHVSVLEEDEIMLLISFISSSVNSRQSPVCK